MGSQNFFSLSPGQDFLGAIADHLVREFDLANAPDALADAVIYLPNRRTMQGLSQKLFEAVGRRAILMPALRAIGDLESDEPPPGAELALANIGNAIPTAQRIGALAGLCYAFYKAQDLPVPVTSIIASAQTLSQLIDQADLAGGVSWETLAGLVPEAEIAEHWQRSVQFLQIIAQAWPSYLSETGMVTPFTRRMAAAQALAAHWADTPPSGYVLMAGSTGSTPASRVLMRAVLALPRGQVILPGLDLAMTHSARDLISQAAEHPQNGLNTGITDLGYAPQDIAPWPGTPETFSPRERLIQEALAPAEATADWIARLEDLAAPESSETFVTQALNGLNLVTAADENEEALCAALLMRDTIETEGKSCALITPDAGLITRVEAILGAMGVEAVASSGTPLLQTLQGSFIFLIAEWVTDPSDPAKLSALLQHDLSLASQSTAQKLDKYVFRGPRLWQNLPNLQEVLAKLDLGEETEAANALFETLNQTLTAHWPVADFQTLAQLATDLAKPEELWVGSAGEYCAQTLEDLAEMTAQLPPLRVEDLAALLLAQGKTLTVAPDHPGHPKLHIWGPLEARLQRADRLILAGLNEDIWPAPAPVDPFLPRRFREPLGLPVPEARIGLAAHDFAEWASGPEVFLLNAARRGGAPALASRWIWRLKTLVRGALGEASEAALAPPPDMNPRDWAKAFTAPPEPTDPRAIIPAPQPPLNARPKRLSVTQINTLQRDPYAIYVSKVLRLDKLDPIGATPDARAFGTAVHSALEAYEEAGAPKGEDALLALLESKLVEAGLDIGELNAFRAVRRQTIRDYLEWRETRPTGKSTRFNEVTGEITLPFIEGGFRLRGTADRVEIINGQSFDIIDFKTGKPPSKKEMDVGFEQQMPLLAMIASEGRLEDVGPHKVNEMIYIRFGNRFEVSPIKGDTAEWIDTAKAGLDKLITQYNNPNQPYLSAPRVKYVGYDNFASLSRRAEWSAMISDGDSE